ncbi:MAG: response regulator transcription factor [Myxococcales bacterium]
MARLLLIDDDPSLLEVLTLAFEDAGHTVTTAPDGAAGLRALDAGGIELVISDVNMPLVDGFALCRKLRQGGSTLPLILLTSRDSDIDEALGLDVGADDYVSKPFSTRVLLSRVTALLRRSELRRGSKATEPTLSVGRLELLPERVELRYAGTPIEVTVTEFRLLECLASRPGVVFSRERLLELLRGDTVVEPRIVDTYVRRLRRKFEQVDPAADVIETVIGAGYRLRGGR